MFSNNKNSIDSHFDDPSMIEILVLSEPLQRNQNSQQATPTAVFRKIQIGSVYYNVLKRAYVHEKALLASAPELITLINANDNSNKSLSFFTVAKFAPEKGFEALVDFCYHGTYAHPTSQADVTEDQKLNRILQHDLKVYTFADRYGIKKLLLLAFENILVAMLAFTPSYIEALRNCTPGQQQKSALMTLLNAAFLDLSGQRWNKPYNHTTWTSLAPAPGTFPADIFGFIALYVSRHNRMLKKIHPYQELTKKSHLFTRRVLEWVGSDTQLERVVKTVTEEDQSRIIDRSKKQQEVTNWFGTPTHDDSGDNLSVPRPSKYPRVNNTPDHASPRRIPSIMELPESSRTMERSPPRDPRLASRPTTSTSMRQQPDHGNRHADLIQTPRKRKGLFEAYPPRRRSTGYTGSGGPEEY